MQDTEEKLAITTKQKEDREKEQEAVRNFEDPNLVLTSIPISDSLHIPFEVG